MKNLENHVALSAESNRGVRSSTTAPFTWQRDGSDQSWSVRDANGTLFRVHEIYVNDLVLWRWALGWQEHDGLRISTRTFPDADKAKAAAEEIWSIIPDKVEVF